FGPDALAVELAMGLCGTYDFAASFSADPDVSSRPFVALLDGLRSFGAHVDEPDPGRLPLTLRGPRLGRPAAIVVPRAAPATKAALILAALNVPGRSVLHDAEPG